MKSINNFSKILEVSEKNNLENYSWLTTAVCYPYCCDIGQDVKMTYFLE